jgi:hypothetical protein
MNRNVITSSDRQDELLSGVPEETIAGMVGSRPRKASARLEADDYKSRLLKYIPAEVVAVYLTLDSIVRSAVNRASLQGWLWLIFAFGLMVTPLFLWRIAKVRRANQLIISTISFAVWVFALGGAFAAYSWYQSFEGAIALVMCTFLIPMFIGK